MSKGLVFHCLNMFPLVACFLVWSLSNFICSTIIDTDEAESHSSSDGICKILDIGGKTNKIALGFFQGKSLLWDWANSLTTQAIYWIKHTFCVDTYESCMDFLKYCTYRTTHLEINHPIDTGGADSHTNTWESNFFMWLALQTQCIYMHVGSCERQSICVFIL